MAAPLHEALPSFLRCIGWGGIADP